MSQSEDDISDPDSIIEPNLLATIFFTAGDVAAPTTSRLIASPADSFPFQDTLLLNRNSPVPVSQINYNVLSFTINPAGPQQNPALPEDVNDDGIVTPVDALTVINTMARGGEGEFAARGIYTDVNGDSITTAVDALRVINHLATSVGQASSGEAEKVVATLASSSPTGSESDDVSRDEAFADLSQQTKLVDAKVGSDAKLPAAASSTFSEADDDDDDILALLAGDQSGLL